MARIIATFFGAALVLLAIAGAVTPGPLGAHASPLANLIHLLCGAAILFVARKAGPSGLFWTSLGLGAFCLVWGLLGFILGRPAESTLKGFQPDLNLLVLIPGLLESARPDHVIHLCCGIGMAIAAVASVAETPFRLRR